MTFNDFFKNVSYGNFSDYLEIVEGITWEEYDENYSGLQADEIWNNFINYDGKDWEDLCLSYYKED